MEKLLTLAAALKQFANLLAALPFVQDNVRKAAADVVTAVDAVEHDLSSDEGRRKIFDWLKHHGNLPGTPESRAADAASKK